MFYALKDIAEKLAHTGKVEPADSTISSQLILSGSSVLRILYLNMGFGVPSAHKLVFGTETGLLRYGILLLIKCFPGEFKDCRGKVAVAAGILVEVVLVVLLGFVETAEGL